MSTDPGPADLAADLAADPELPDPLIGRVIDGKYQIKKLLGAGGMGSVYEAYHRVIGKRVAVKVLHREFCSSPEIVQRFQREARAATSIGHPNIVDVFDMGAMEGGGFFQVIELLEGRSLGDELDANGPLSYARAVKILSQVADALAATHDKGIIHRDLKPDNVFLVNRPGDPDFVKLLDFGVAKMADANTGARTHTGMAIGTPAYMSPEQAQGTKDIDHRTDIFALGVMTFEVLANARPFHADSYAMVLFQICVGDTPQLALYRDDVPEGLQRVIERMLEKKKEARFPDCRAVREALAPFAGFDGAPVLHGVAPERQPIPISAIKRVADPGSAATMAAVPSTPPVASPPTPSSTQPIPAPAAAPASTSTQPMPSMPSQSASRSTRLMVVSGLVGLAAAGFAATWALSSDGSETPAAVTAPPAVTTVHVSISAEPANAVLFIDDALVDNPYVVDVPASSAAHIVEARLEGYTSARRAVTFAEPVEIALSLTASAPAVGAEAPTEAPVVAAPAIAGPAEGEAPAAGPRHGRPSAPSTSPSVTATPVASAPVPPSAPPPPAADPEPEPEVPARALKTVVF